MCMAGRPVFSVRQEPAMQLRRASCIPFERLVAGAPASRTALVCRTLGYERACVERSCVETARMLDGSVPVYADPRIPLVRQVGTAAFWAVRCTGGCTPTALQTSAKLHVDDYETNYLLQLSCGVCAVPFPRLNEALKFVGLGQLMAKDQTAAQRESEQVLAHQAHASMARAWEKEQRLGIPSSDGCLLMDSGWSSGRNASDCTQPTMSAATGSVLHLEHSRRSDPDIKSSQALEQRNCWKTVAHPLIKSLAYSSASVDGCTATVKTLKKANFYLQGDPWHAIKIRGKSFRAFLDAFAPREGLTDAEQAAKAMTRVERPKEPIAGKVVALGKPQAELPTPSSEEMRARLRVISDSEAAGTDAEVGSAYEQLRLVQHMTAALSALPTAVSAPPKLADLPLSGYAQQLSSVYKIASRRAVSTEAERAAWIAYDTYALAQLNADAARAARTVRNRKLKEARTTAGAWERELRSVYDMVFRHTARLRKTTNSITGQPWTNDERTALAQQLYPECSLHLACGFVNADCLVQIRHPSTKQKSEAWSWAPPARGDFIKVDSLEFEILESWVRDPRCLEKFEYYIGVLWPFELLASCPAPSPLPLPNGAASPQPPTPPLSPTRHGASHRLPQHCVRRDVHVKEAQVEPKGCAPGSLLHEWHLVRAARP
jgi:hypothetical protein